ncbi:DNA-directed RNA polymerase III subunit RPC3 [Trichoplax sp. H2]|nr:DNA-directed RNA polymerase III subunit RPC3 [Trichoplax sp. H2]|eukprot:RDD45187.1 DNA-directed RNA polymerase III subunit RPC3 [Trichoplax sp. H2]
MSDINLCVIKLARLLFGEVVEHVVSCLAQKGGAPLRDIIQRSKLSKDEVKNSLCILLQHDLIDYTLSNTNGYLYRLKIDRILLCNRYPRYIYASKFLFGDIAELIVEEILLNGQIIKNELLDQIKSRLADIVEKDNTPPDPTEVDTAFDELARNNFIIEVGGGRMLVKSEVEQVDKMTPTTNNKPSEEVSTPKKGNKRQRSEDIPSAPVSKRLHLEEGTNEINYMPSIDESQSFWRVNFSRFHIHFRNEMIVEVIGKKYDSIAAAIMRSMLELDANPQESDIITNAVRLKEIKSHLPKEVNVTKSILEEYLTILHEDKQLNTGDPDILHIFSEIVKRTLECLVQQRFGSNFGRIFRIIVHKKSLEQKKICDMAMLPSKDAKAILYTLMVEKFIRMQEIPRSLDCVASKTFHLFSLDILDTCTVVLSRSYKAIANSIIRRDWEVNSNRQREMRLLDKSERLKTMKKSVLANTDGNVSIDETIRELEESITPIESQQLKILREKFDRLDYSEMQVDATIFSLRTFLYLSRVQAKDLTAK